MNRAAIAGDQGSNFALLAYKLHQIQVTRSHYLKCSYFQRISCIACHDVQAKCQAKFATGIAVPD